MTVPAVYPKSHSPHPPEPQAGLPMFGWVAPGAIARAAQPTAYGFESLDNRGFKTIVSLRAEGRSDLLSAGAPVQATLMRLPWMDEEAPSSEQARVWLEIANDPDNWPLLVHCKAGRGRTGVACALLRYTFDGWPMALAREEILLYRPGIGRFKWPMCRAQKAFLARWALTHQPGVYPLVPVPWCEE